MVEVLELIAWERRLIFDSNGPCMQIPSQNAWPELIALTLAARRSTKHQIRRLNEKDSSMFAIHSSNPDLQLRFDTNTDSHHLPFSLFGGSPFLEAAELRGRWFLRDGYHRACRLMQAGVYRVPTVVIYARTLEELGATEPYFFCEEQLFSDRPPRVSDFLMKILCCGMSEWHFVK